MEWWSTSTCRQAAPAGSYRVTYRIVSADDHTVAGAIDFEVRSSSPDPTPSPTTPQPTEPAPSPTPSPTSAARSQTQVLPSSGGSTTAKDALTIVGFSVVTMTGLVLLLRAGLKSAGSEDED
ncbi:copper resistance protein CopC [Aeromicrobium sp. 50.2.37]|uniref:copper resistance protein CopC n=1 Tax=Aeromicrobium sp. 50.2.37 TaxID=2969305 RepID=UPI0035B3D68F